MASHLIFGAGLIGGFMAASFASRGQSVTALGRESMRNRFQDRLIATDYNDNRVDVDTVGFLASGETGSESFDFIWLTVKCIGLAQALKDIEPFVTAQSVIISCQNGLGSEKEVAASFPEHTVLRAIMQPNVAELAHNHLHRGSEGDLYVQPYSVGGQSLASFVNSAVLPCTQIEDVEAFAWAKLQLNVANAINALADRPVKEMLENKQYRKIIAESMRELIAVASAKGLTLPKIAAVPMKAIPLILDLPNFLFEIAGRKMMDIDPTVRTSMWHDLKQGRLTEVDYLNGALVKEGERLGVPCPVNTKIVELIHNAEQTRELPDLVSEIDI